MKTIGLVIKDTPKENKPKGTPKKEDRNGKVQK